MTLASRAYQRLAPYHAVDAANGHALEALTRGLVAPLEICEVARDSDTHIAWGSVLDPDAAPEQLLAWLAQFSGDQILPGDTVAEQRSKLTSPSNFYRGTITAIRAAIRPVLTGARQVTVLERVGGDEFAVTIVTRTSETPDPAAVVRAARWQIAPWLILTFVTSDLPIIDEGGAARTIDQIGTAGTTIVGVTVADWT